MLTGTTPLIAAWATAVPPWGTTTAVRGVTQVVSAAEHPAKTNRCHLQTETSLHRGCQPTTTGNRAVLEHGVTNKACEESRTRLAATQEWDGTAR